MSKIKELTQAEKDARTSFWCINAAKADILLAKIHAAKIKISCYVDYNSVILNRDLTKKEYKLIFPIVKSNLL